jgi:hypothetical protein
VLAPGGEGPQQINAKATRKNSSATIGSAAHSMPA